MGDDDVWLPGSVARVLKELNLGADACLCSTEICDLDLKPIVALNWFRDPSPPAIWHLESREDLIRYFDSCSYTAGVFAFISATIYRRDRFLESTNLLQKALGSQYIHLWGMVASLGRPLELHFVSEILVRTRVSDSYADSYAATNLYGRWMSDFHAWAHVSDAVFGGDADLHGAFSRILWRNHGGDSFLPRFRVCVPTQEDWLHAVPYLVRAGFSPLLVAAVDFGFRHRNADRLPTPTQKPETHGFAILPFLAREGKPLAILALGGLQNIVDGAALLASLRTPGRAAQIRVFCTTNCQEIMEGFEFQCVDAGLYIRDENYRASIVKSLLDFAPELAINLDPVRGIEADDLMAAVHPLGALAYELPDRGQDTSLRRAANAGYTCLAPESSEPGVLLEALGLESLPATLWPTSAAREESRAMLAKLGWDPARTLVILVDHPCILDDASFRTALAEAASGSWTFVGLGGKGVSYQSMETLLGPLNHRAVNLTGVIGLGTTAALLQRCGGYLGGTPLLQTLAAALGCAQAH